MSEPLPLNSKCPNCGADLPPADAQGLSYCEFCRHAYRTAPEPTPQPSPQRPEVFEQVIVQQIVSSTVSSVVQSLAPAIQPKRRGIGFGAGCMIVVGLFFGALTLVGWVLQLMAAGHHASRVIVQPPTAPMPSWQRTYVPPAPTPPPASAPVPSKPSSSGWPKQPWHTPAPPPAHRVNGHR